MTYHFPSLSFSMPIKHGGQSHSPGRLAISKKADPTIWLECKDGWDLSKLDPSSITSVSHFDHDTEENFYMTVVSGERNGKMITLQGSVVIEGCDEALKDHKNMAKPFWFPVGEFTAIA